MLFVLLFFFGNQSVGAIIYYGAISFPPRCSPEGSANEWKIMQSVAAELGSTIVKLFHTLFMILFFLLCIFVLNERTRKRRGATIEYVALDFD